MPEVARFFGIIIRMYAEVGAPHNRPHFHAYYQDSAAVHSIDELEVGCQDASVDWWKHGQSYIKMSYYQIGSSYNKGSHHRESNL